MGNSMTLIKSNFSAFTDSTFFGASLQKTLQLHSLEDILDSDFVSTQNIIHNMTQINKNGVVNNIERKGMLKRSPFWPPPPAKKKASKSYK